MEEKRQAGLSRIRSRVKATIKERFPGANMDYCLTCGLCASGCPATGIEGMDPRKFLRLIALGQDEEILNTDWIYVCTMCQRCKYACPMDINIGRIVYEVRGLRPRDRRPPNLQKTCDFQKTKCSTGISDEDFAWVVNDVLEEVRQNEPEWADLEAPIDKQGAEYFLNQNAKDPTVSPEEMVHVWKILHEAGVNWTYSSKWWDGANYCVFTGDSEDFESTVRAQVETVNALGCKYYLNTECGHIYYAVQEGIKRFNIPHRFELVSIVTLYAQLIRDGRLRLDPSWNSSGLKFTVQDPCKLVRQGVGDPVADDLRFVIKSVAGEENFIDVWPNKSNNYCCGGGGGALQAGFKDQRRRFGKFKFDQLEATGADVVITPCYNCHSHIADLCEYYGGKWQVTHLWDWIVKAMVRK